MKTKLTLVSVIFKGIRKSIFVNAPIINDKAVVSSHVINAMLFTLGCHSRGETFSIG